MNHYADQNHSAALDHDTAESDSDFGSTGNAWGTDSGNSHDAWDCGSGGNVWEVDARATVEPRGDYR